MKKLLRPFVLAVTLGLGLSMIVGCAPRNPNRAAVGQHVCITCGDSAATAAKCTKCYVDMVPTSGDD